MSELTNTDTAACLNCGKPMSGAYCSNCGQQNKNVRRPFLIFMDQFLHVVLDLDGRAYRSVYYLFTRPGFLTREYFAGRRTQYTPPLRLFLVISISFFLLVGVVTSLRSMQQSFVEQSLVGQATTNLTTGAGAAVDADDGINLSFSADDEDEVDLAEIRRVVASIELPFVSAQTNQNLQTVVIAQVEENLQEATENTTEFFLDWLENITIFILLMIPILALIQKIVLILCKRFYVEHLILTLHNHAFLILAIFLSMVVGTIEDLDVPLVSALFGYLNIALVCWIMAYLYLSLKNYFETGYGLTAVIFITITAIYSVVIGMGISAFAILLFIFA
jgi:hypothetical protein